MEAGKFILSMLVSNESGVLTRVSALFGRRGYNIDSLSVGETENPEVSRITVKAAGDAEAQEQILNQLKKLPDVRVAAVMDLGRTVLRELMLIKLSVGAQERGHVMEAVNVFRAKVVDLSPESMTVEITGEKTKLDSFVVCLEPYGITELCRTGVTAIGRNGYSLKEESEKE